MTMLEIERKILEIDKKALLAKIATLQPSAEKLFDGLVRVKYFDFADARIRKKKDLLRVREFIPKRATPYTELVYKTYKGVKTGCKYFEEREMVFPGNDYFIHFSAFFGCLKLRESLHYEKRRTHFAFKNVRLEIDEHPGIPPFLEIEGPSPAAIDAAIKTLGLGDHEQSCETIQELLTRKYKGVKLNGLVFKE